MPEEKRVISSTYPANSMKSKEAADTEKKEKVERVVTAQVVQRKKSLGKRIAESFTGEDAHSVGSYLVFEVGLPALKNLLSDMVSQGVERMLFGDATPRANGRRTYVNYNRPGSGSRPPWERVQEQPSRTLGRQQRATHDFDDIVIADVGEAERVLYELMDRVNKYDAATVSDLYEMVGITGSFTDDKWGWTDLSTASVRRVRDGYLLDLPRTGPIH